MNTIIVGPVPPYRAGIAYCTMRLAEEMKAEVISYKRQYPRWLYPGTSDLDESLRDRTPKGTRFLLDILNPFTWIRTGLALRKADAVIFVWWVWVWALPYLTLIAFLPKRTRVILQCHNIGDKEPAAWKRWLTNRVLRRGDALVVHAKSEAADAARRVKWRTGNPACPDGKDRQDCLSSTPRIVQAMLPVHEMGGPVPSREHARATLGLRGNVALSFGHVRPYKGVDIALNAWRMLKTDVTLVVAGEVWWKNEDEYRELAHGLQNVRLDFRFIPDAEIATYFAATDVVLAPYRVEAQSGVALTAFHFARPVIASTVGGLPEIVEDDVNGLLIPPEDPAALANAVDAFFTRADRTSMERAAAASAKKYSWEEYAKVFEGLVTGT